MTSKDMVTKLPKTEVNYTNYSGQPDRECVLCSHYAGHGVCEMVRGLVSPDGWCKAFLHR